MGLVAPTFLAAGLVFATEGLAAPTEQPRLTKIGTAFTCPGYLEDAGVTVNDLYDLTLSAFDSAGGCSQAGSMRTLEEVKRAGRSRSSALDTATLPAARTPP